ncbi:MAG TPA: hypothetical protein VGF13_12925 [Verrucomicrobiae bacterium]|jgi:hypothetical protein
MDELPSALAPLFWTAVALSGLAGFGLLVGLTLLLRSQRSFVLRIIWISAALFVASAAAWILIFAQH